MKIIKNSINIELDFKTRYPLDEICFMDIETTGLSKKFHQIYLIGVFVYDSDAKLWKLSQFFSESDLDEKLILKEFVEELKAYKYLITYNGDNFDIPFVNEKLLKYDMEPINIESIDLYKVLRTNKDFIKFSNLKLKTVEKELGIYREDAFTGLECIEFYKNYLVTKSNSLFKYIIKHNHDDLESMPKLLNIFSLIEQNSSIEIKLFNGYNALLLKNIELSGDLIILRGNWMDTFPISAEYYKSFYTLYLSNNLDFLVKIEVNRARLEGDRLAYYVDTSKFGLNNRLEDLSGYKPPPNILILRINKENILENIKSLTKEILLSISGTNK